MVIRPPAFRKGLAGKPCTLYKVGPDGRILRVLRWIHPEERDLVGQTPESVIRHPQIAAACRELMADTRQTGNENEFTAQVLRGGELVLRLCIIQPAETDNTLIHSLPFGILIPGGIPTNDL